MKKKELEQLRIEAINKLKDLNKKIKYTTEEKSYYKMLDIIIKYDTKAKDKINLFDEYRKNLKIVHIETIKDYGKKQFEMYGTCIYPNVFTDIAYESNIYMINRKGNLQNITFSALKKCIINIIEVLEKNIDKGGKYE